MSTYYHRHGCGCAACVGSHVTRYPTAHPSSQPFTLNSSAYDRTDWTPSTTSRSGAYPDHHNTGRHVPGRYEDEDGTSSDDGSHEVYKTWHCDVCRKVNDWKVDKCPCTKAPAVPAKREKTKEDLLTVNLTVQNGTYLVIDTRGEKRDESKTEEETDEESDDGTESDGLVMVDNDKDWEDQQEEDKTAGKGKDKFLLVDFEKVVTAG